MNKRLNIFKGIRLIGLLLMLSHFSSFSNLMAAKVHKQFTIEQIKDTLPVLNKEILTFVDTHLHHKVGSGECWDLAAIPLNNLHAKWDRQYVFGKLLRPAKDSVLPGDIIQFDGVVVSTTKGNSHITMYLTQHTAIIYKVLENLHFVLAQQNTSDYGRTVSMGEIDLSHLEKGRFMIYRPVD